MNRRIFKFYANFVPIVVDSIFQGLDVNFTHARFWKNDAFGGLEGVVGKDMYIYNVILRACVSAIFL